MSSRDERGSSHFVLGMGIGALLGLLFAPHSGKETRKKLKEDAQTILEKVEPGVTEVWEKVSPYVEALEEVGEPYKEELAEHINDFLKKKLGKKNVEKVKQLLGGTGKD